MILHRRLQHLSFDARVAAGALFFVRESVRIHIDEIMATLKIEPGTEGKLWVMLTRFCAKRPPAAEANSGASVEPRAQAVAVSQHAGDACGVSGDGRRASCATAEDAYGRTEAERYASHMHSSPKWQTETSR